MPASSRPPAPDRCALVVVDMQNDFCHPEGGLARLGQDTSRAQAIVAPLRDLTGAARDAGVPVIFVRTTHGPWTDTPAWRARGLGGPTLDVGRVPICEEGGWGAELYGVEPTAADLVVTKHRYSGFAHTPLELALRAKARDTVVLGGTATNVCVEATATDALIRGFHPVLVPECAATKSAAADAAAAEEFADHLGAVVALSDLLAAWRPRVPTPTEGAPR